MAIRRESSRRSASEGECGGTSYPKSYPTSPCPSTANSLNLLIESPRSPQRRRPNRAPPVYEVGSRQTCPGTPIRNSRLLPPTTKRRTQPGVPHRETGSVPHQIPFSQCHFGCTSETAFRGRPRI